MELPGLGYRGHDRVDSSGLRIRGLIQNDVISCKEMPYIIHQQASAYWKLFPPLFFASSIKVMISKMKHIEKVRLRANTVCVYYNGNGKELPKD